MSARSTHGGLLGDSGSHDCRHAAVLGDARPSVAAAGSAPAAATAGDVTTTAGDVTTTAGDETATAADVTATAGDATVTPMGDRIALRVLRVLRVLRAEAGVVTVAVVAIADVRAMDPAAAPGLLAEGVLAHARSLSCAVAASERCIGELVVVVVVAVAVAGRCAG
jgi:hypothetical protein